VQWIGTALVVAAALRYWLWYFDRATNLLDEGSTAAQALRIVNGDLIYRDFFTVVTPGSYYTIAWLFDIFGTQLIVLRWAALVTGLGIVVATIVVARRIMPWPFAAAAGLMTTVWGWFLVTPNYYSLQAALFALIALALFLQSTERATAGTRRGAALLVGAGVMAGLAALVKQNIGVYTAVGLLGSIWLASVFVQSARPRMRASAMFIGGLSAPIVVTLAYLLAAGAGPYLYESWVYYPFTRYPERFSLPYPAFYPVLPEYNVTGALDAMAAVLTGRVPEPAVFDIWAKFVVYLPVLVYPFAIAALAVLAWRARRRDDTSAATEGAALAAIALVGVLVLLQAWPRADVPHILFGLQPTFVLFAYVLSCCARGLAFVPGPRAVVRSVTYGLALAPLAMFLWNGYQRTDWEYANYVAHLRTPRAQGIRTLPIEAQRIDFVTTYISEHTSPDDPIFVVPWAAGFYFLADRDNPTRTDFLLFEDPETYPCLLSRLDARPPKYVIYGYTWDVDGRHFRDYAAPIDLYIRSRYTIEVATDGYEIWRRLDGAPSAHAPWQNACQPRRFRLSDLMERDGFGRR
jgi:hypothetical protein